MNTVEKKQYYLEVIGVLFELKYKNIETIHLYFRDSEIDRDINELMIDRFYFWTCYKECLNYNNLKTKDTMYLKIKEIFELIIDFLKKVSLQEFENFNL